MSRDVAKALIVKWRVKAHSFTEIAAFHKESKPELAQMREKAAEAYRECAEDLDVACGSLS